jgi:hypothetical protein
MGPSGYQYPSISPLGGVDPSPWTKLAGLQTSFQGKTVDTSNPYDINFKDESKE